MMTWQLLNSLGLIAVSAVLYLVLRQMGFVLNRVGPSGARGSADGPRIGENISHQIPEVRQSGKAKLIVFGADSCPVCARVKSDAVEIARNWKSDAEIFLIYDSATLGDVTSVPFAIVTNEHGEVMSKGLVNEGAHLESLLEQQRSAATRELSGQFIEVKGV
jgi:hypothetical protein